MTRYTGFALVSTGADSRLHAGPGGGDDDPLRIL